MTLHPALAQSLNIPIGGGKIYYFFCNFDKTDTNTYPIKDLNISEFKFAMFTKFHEDTIILFFKEKPITEDQKKRCTHALDSYLWNTLVKPNSEIFATEKQEVIEKLYQDILEKENKKDDINNR